MTMKKFVTKFLVRQLRGLFSLLIVGNDFRFSRMVPKGCAKYGAEICQQQLHVSVDLLI